MKITTLKDIQSEVTYTYAQFKSWGASMLVLALDHLETSQKYFVEPL